MGKKLTKEEVLERFKKVHGNKYDYSLFDKYESQYTKIKIICPKHGVFEQTPKAHFQGQKCYKCSIEEAGNKLKKTTEQFIREAKLVHGDKYDYSLVDYQKNDKEIKIICPKHGVFEQRPINHLRGEKCYKCSKEITGEKLSSNSKEFIKKAKLVHGDKYDYSLVDYKRNNIKIKIICPKHGIFEQIPNSHLKGRGCKECQKKTTEHFIKEAKEIHGDKYDYSLVKYISASTPVKIICPKHGIFEQKPYHHLKRCGCKKCHNSHGEEKIELFLLSNNIEHILWKTFDDLKDKTKLSYDFYLPKHNILIEYNGKQHYNPNSFRKYYKKFLIQKHHDWLKRKYAIKNGYRFLVIPYWEFDNIDKILSEELDV